MQDSSTIENREGSAENPAQFYTNIRSLFPECNAPIKPIKSTKVKNWKL